MKLSGIRGLALIFLLAATTGCLTEQLQTSGQHGLNTIWADSWAKFTVDYNIRRSMDKSLEGRFLGYEEVADIKTGYASGSAPTLVIHDSTTTEVDVDFDGTTDAYAVFATFELRITPGSGWGTTVGFFRPSDDYWSWRRVMIQNNLYGSIYGWIDMVVDATTFDLVAATPHITGSDLSLSIPSSDVVRIGGTDFSERWVFRTTMERPFRNALVHRVISYLVWIL